MEIPTHVVMHVVMHVGAGLHRRVRRAAASGAALLALVGCRAGEPARLTLPGTSGMAIVHGIRASQLAVQVRDARGRPVDSSGVRFRQVAGDPVRLTDRGLVTCDRRADAEVEASLGALRLRVPLRCRPIAAFLASE
jgi:hypothetical protein